MRIALVDPSRTNRKIVTRLLQARGHDVLLFEDGPEALARMRSDFQIDALITSAELTSTSGLELCWETRLLASSRRPIYILLMSSNSDRDALVEALDSGADDFINKPPVAEELYARLRAAERIETLQRELIRLATTDPLTGVANRRGFFEEASEACRRAKQGSSLSAILIDIDHFKEVNDLYGHSTGDEAIRAIALEAQSDEAVVGRLGGDEFSILLKGRPLSTAMRIAESLRRRFAALRLKTPEGMTTLTCSLGVSELEPNDTVDDLLGRADLALYKAKEEGRNRVATSPSVLWIRQHPRKSGAIARAQAR
jgi:two-component system cell cycle response regulator